MRGPLRGAIVVVSLALSLAGAATLSACSGRSASEILETAQLEEKQNALDHARKLYREVIEKYPGTPEAAQAKARLEAIGSTP
jgi:hypothetical protein